MIHYKHNLRIPVRLIRVKAEVAELIIHRISGHRVWPKTQVIGNENQDFRCL